MSDTNTVVRSRIDPMVKNEASKILRSMGLTLSDGIRLFLYQTVAQKKLPFSVKTRILSQSKRWNLRIEKKEIKQPLSRFLKIGMPRTDDSSDIPIQNRSQDNC